MPKPQGAVCGHQTPDAPEPRPTSVALAQLIAVVALALSTLIAATAVSIGLARADVVPAIADLNAAPFAATPSTKGGAE
jgi:hypothetical protein